MMLQKTFFYTNKGLNEKYKKKGSKKGKEMTEEEMIEELEDDMAFWYFKGSSTDAKKKQIQIFLHTDLNIKHIGKRRMQKKKLKRKKQMNQSKLKQNTS